MENFKVRAVDFEQKSVVEVEQELIEQHEQKLAEQQVEETPQVEVDPEVQPTVGIKDEDVLSYIGNRYNKEIKSLDELFEQRESNGDLDPEIATYMKYKQETGRSYDDFVKLNRDIDKVDQMTLLAEYKKQVEELDDEDVAWELSKYQYDEDLDDESEIKEKKLAVKKELKKAKEYFEKQKDQYKVPLESRSNSVPDVDREEIEAFRKYKQSESSQEEENQKRSQYFADKTDSLFNDKFEGFKYNVGEESFVFKPAEANALKKSQSNLVEFIQSFLDENGYLKDAEDYHRRIAMAMNPEKFAQYFYEQGKAKGIEGISRDSKNIDMSTRTNTQVAPNNTGFQVRSVDDGTNGIYKIKSKSKNN
jgi:hypothetical protein